VSTDSYQEYLHTEWSLFANNRERAEASREALTGIPLNRVLDIGCGAGQELMPFATTAFCVGTDIAEIAGRVGRELFEAQQPNARVAFVRAAAEALPFQSNSFDAVICRLALPYTHNAQALAEIARMLKPGGVLLLKIHHARYYANKCRNAILSGDVLSLIHAVRVLIAGTIYHGTGKQIRTKVPSPETFQTEWLLRRELKKLNLFIRGELPGSNPLTPSFVITRSRAEG
jgi:ubiquinone/menaquinone biosynthesis C-methylase UbiE